MIRSTSLLLRLSRLVSASQAAPLAPAASAPAAQWLGSAPHRVAAGSQLVRHRHSSRSPPRSCGTQHDSSSWPPRLPVRRSRVGGLGTAAGCFSGGAASTSSSRGTGSGRAASTASTPSSGSSAGSPTTGGLAGSSAGRPLARPQPQAQPQPQPSGPASYEDIKGWAAARLAGQLPAAAKEDRELVVELLRAFQFSSSAQDKARELFIHANVGAAAHQLC
jgi:predicted component of type VI protein secretion system